MNQYIHWEADVECTACNGTGLYQGMAEKGGAAVVCYVCKGTGKQHVEHNYIAFVERKERSGVTRVFNSSGGYIITDKDIITPEGKEIRFSQAGCSYEEWKKGVEPKPIRELVCPLIHYQQGTDKGEWLKNKGPCKDILWREEHITKCADKNRDECWAKHDRGEFFKE